MTIETRSQSSSSSGSFIPQYQPQLQFLTQWGNELSALERQQWDWAQQQFGRGSALTNTNINYGYLPGAEGMFDAAAKDITNYNEMFNPEFARLTADANYYNSPLGQANEMGKAEATGATNFQAQRHNLEAELGSYGIDMNANTPKFASQLKEMDMRQAASEAAAANMARQAAETTGRALTQEQLNDMARLPGQAITDTNVGFQGMTGAQNAYQGATALGALTEGTTPQYLQTGIEDVKFQPLGQTSSSQSSSEEHGVG